MISEGSCHTEDTFNVVYMFLICF